MIQFLKRFLVSSMILLSSCRPALADDPAGLVAYPPNSLMGFRGLDTRSKAPNLEDMRAVDLQNVKLSAALNLQKRKGYSVVRDTLDDGPLTSPAITGIFDAEYSNGTSWTYAFVGNKLKYDNGTTWTEIDNVSKAPTITSGQDNQFQCLMALDSAICTNDVDNVVKISSTPNKAPLAFTGLSETMGHVKTMIYYRNYLILGNTHEGSTERPTRFRWSDVGTIETWQDDNFVDLSTFAGDEIIGFAELYGELYIFLKKSIWKASLVGGNDVFVFRKMVDGIGAISRDSIRLVQFSGDRTAVIFLDDRKKVLMYDGTSVSDIGAIIQDTSEGFDGISPSRLQYSTSTFDGKSYFLSTTASGGSSNSIVFEFQTEIFEWTKHTNINANAFAQVKEATAVIKTYFGDYGAVVYWMDDTDLSGCDVDCGSGIIDSVGTSSAVGSFTGLQMILDSALTSGEFKGALLTITSGTGAGESRVIYTDLNTGVVVVSAFTTTPDSTSVYSIGGIEAHYYAKHFDLGYAQKEKQFLGMLLFASEDTSDEVTVAHAVDFGSNLDSETVSLAPSGSSLWDEALWDAGTWGTSGNKIYTVKFSGFGNFIQPKFSNDGLDEDFDLFGYNLLGIITDTKQ